MSVPIENLPAAPGAAWTGLRDELLRILGDDLVAVWAYGGTITAPADAPIGDLDTFVVVRGAVDAETARTIEHAQDAISVQTGADWDAWYVRAEDAEKPAMPRHAWRDRLNESWAIDRAHWLGGRYVLLYGAQPAEIVPPPTRADLDDALRAEVAHLERHVEAGDTDPYEATYAFLNGSRIVRAIETGDVVISKREAGPWGLEHLPDRWHPTLEAALRAYDHRALPDDEGLLAREMAPFVAMVRRRIP
jgi:Aminoglycoside adenylyltransferase, C-terminal domain